MSEMICNETGYKIITVIVIRTKIQNEFLPCVLCGCLEQLWPELFFQKLICQTLIYQDRQSFRRCPHKFKRIIGRPTGTIRTKISAECFFTPWYLRWRHNG